jgi:hypothetical protein
MGTLLIFCSDADSNVLYRNNTVLASHSELYSYDSLDRLTSFSRGTLNSSNNAITSATTTESWNYDAVGNWNSSTLNGATTTRTNSAQESETGTLESETGTLLISESDE